ncbi:hypothetical protein VNO78_33116 [Psophocarpus tetragonolobus]|uniref:Uncharacterized protein n=1 Tax=Psophocarpus tetragonolobus TaxID=3891 RepID=A0AAN9RPG6_PSOTE
MMPMMNSVGFKLMFMMVCLVLQIVYAEHGIMCIQREREALLQFKASIVDHYGMLSSWNTADCCQWEGIQCSNLTGHIVMLDSRSNSFYGSHIPEFLGSLRNLRYLDLSRCGFGGKIPSKFGSLSHLKFLNLAWNNLEGSIPHQLGNLSMLQYLNLGSNCFEGIIPSQLGNLSSLQELYLGGYDNAFKIDDGNHARDQWLSNLISLTLLNLDDMSSLNTSHGWMQMIAKLPKLRELSLSGCSLSDHFIISLRPFKFNFSTSLLVFDLSDNTFMSSLILFQWFSNITSHIVELDLSFNHLEGSRSNDFGMVMNSLQHLDLSYNNFKGEDLKSFMNICTLHSLNMHDNNLTEDLPSILHYLSSGCIRHSVQDLNLYGNQITGSLPDLSVFSSLKTLDLSYNCLSGKTPEGSKLPSQLEYLSIQSNTIEGGIPKSFGNACALLMLDMSDNRLSEELPMIIYHLSGCTRYSLEILYLDTNAINGTLPNLSIFLSLQDLYLYGNKLNGEVPKDIQFPPQLKRLYLQSNFLKGVLSDYHFTNMSQLHTLDLSDNSLALTFTPNWVLPFKLTNIRLRSCVLGPTFPKWLQTQNDLQQLDISNAGISDMVPRWFWEKLPFGIVDLVNISCNNLYGIIPKFLQQKNISSSLILASNKFEGPIPPFLQASTFLDLSKNNFSGSLSFLCAGSRNQTLYQLDLSNNQLSGQIPDCLSHFESLVYLDLSHNKLSGKIPSSLGSLHDLQALLLRNNNFTHEIPSSLRSCTKLVMLDLAENKLSGPIPTWIGNETQELRILSLGRNNFYGNLPLQICHLKSMQLLDLSLNNLSGKIPVCIKNFTSMAQNAFSRDDGYHQYFVIQASSRTGGENHSQYLNAFLMWKGSEHMFKNNQLFLLKSIDLSSNNFSEEVPIEIETLLGLVSLNLSRNKLTGKIPSNIGKLTSLEFLDLSRNQFVGSIPQSLAQIPRLAMLDLSHNHLSGEIPTSTQLQSFNPSSYEDNANLCGPPLEKSCIDARNTQESIVEVHKDEYSLFNREFYISMALGFVIGFWMVFGSILFKHSWRHAYFKFMNNLLDIW